MRIEIGGIPVEHRINPRMKNIYLVVETDGTVVLKSNGKHPRRLRSFFESKRAWIDAQLERAARRPKMVPGESILFRGALYPPAELGIVCGAGTDREALCRRYHRFYRTEAEAYLLERTARFAREMGIGYEAVRFRRMKRRWGSCSKKGTITYNTLLMQLEPELIDYTVVHELAHRVHFNHSKAFHALVRSVLPDEKELRRRMKAHHIQTC